jgi:hypothetical protein
MREALLKEGITVAKGLLWKDGEVIDTITSDEIANQHGFMYVERLIAAVEQEDEEKS